MTREEYGQIYHHVFPSSSRKACREGWGRWQQVRASGMEAMVLHPPGPPLPPLPDDHLIIATAGPLRFLARVKGMFLPTLSKQWSSAAAEAVAELGQNPRARARAFLHNSLVDGYVLDPTMATLMAGSIVWLLSTMDGLPVDLSDYHLFGYDISYVPGPPGRGAMFNFRALLQLEADLSMLSTVREMPLPDWRPPPN
jgi:hypothetical protein